MNETILNLALLKEKFKNLLEKKMDKKKVLTSPCGLDCFNCELYEENITDDLKKTIHSKMGVPMEDIPCKGCRKQDGTHFHIPNGCRNLDCVKEKGHDFCFECDDFPCEILAPISDKASMYPHNIKVYNLCKIKNEGIEKWIKKSSEIRAKYFKKKFVVGKGHED